MSFDPADHGANGLFAAEDGAGGIVKVVGVEREIDVASLDEQDEGLTSRQEARERCTDESQVPSIVMTASPAGSAQGTEGTVGPPFAAGMFMDAR